MNMAAPGIIATSSPNPVANNNMVRYKLDQPGQVQIVVYDELGKPLQTLVNKNHNAGTYDIQWSTAGLARGAYFINIMKNGEVKQTIRLVKQ